MTDFAKYNAKDLGGFHEYQPLKPFSQVELTALYEMWTKQERERIIKLLEESMAICAKNQHEDGCDACYGQRDAIALIKGEQNG